MNWPMANHEWFGEWPVMLTPMREGRSIDYEALARLTDWYIEQGAVGLFACCQSSEVQCLTEREKLAVAQAVLTRAAGRVPVVVGAIGQADDQARRDAARSYREHGAVAVILSVAEFGEKADPEPVVLERLTTFAQSVPDIDLGIYECPVPYHRLLSPSGIAEIARTGRFTWFKDTCCEESALREKTLAARGSRLHIFNAHSPLMRLGLELGCTGHSGIAANFSTALCAEVCRPTTTTQRARRCLEIICRGDKLVLGHGYPASVKHMLHRRGVIGNHVCRRDTSQFTQVAASLMDQLLRDLVDAETNQTPLATTTNH